MLNNDLLRGAKQASHYLGLKPRWIYGLCAKDAIPFARIGGRLYFRKSELDRAFSGEFQPVRER